MMVFLPTRLHAFAAAMILAAGGSSSFASAEASYSVEDCAGFEALPTTLTEDVSVFLEDRIEFTCAGLEEERYDMERFKHLNQCPSAFVGMTTTVMVNGPFTYRVMSDNFNVKFTNIRFEVGGGAEFTFHLAQGETLGTATFTGVTEQGSNGGVFNVESGSSATFGNLMAFDGNTVTSGYSGGAVYVGGEVDFNYEVEFMNNQALHDGDYDAGNGGALAVGGEGDVVFRGVATFTGNTANSGGSGGAVSNLGYAKFKKRSYFYSNTAKENGDETGGQGGALHSSLDATTILRAKSVMSDNTAGNGGAIYNRSGRVTLRKATFNGNQALGGDRADGGHVHTAGEVSISNKAVFKAGFARAGGGAAYIVDGGELVLPSDVTYKSNSASEECDDVYAEGEEPVCQP